MTSHELKEALERAFSQLFSKMERDLENTARGINEASDQLRLIATALNRPRQSDRPTRFTGIRSVAANRIVLADGVRPGRLRPMTQVRILSPLLEPRHDADYLRVQYQEDQLIVLVEIPVAACAGDWLEWRT